MTLPKTAKFRGRVERRQKDALARREANIKTYKKESNTPGLDANRVAQLAIKISRAEDEISSLRKKLHMVTT